jgi:hypothetical protein
MTSAAEKRWAVTLVYRTDHGDVDVEHQVEELEDIATLVERGPHWDSLVEGTFRINPKRSTSPGLTVEQSNEL